MRRALRGMATMIGTSVRASPRLAFAVFALTAIGGVAQPLMAYGAKLLADGVVARDGRTVVVAVAAIALTRAGPMVAGNLGIGTLRMTMEDRTRLRIESHIIELAASVPGIEHHESPAYANEMQLLRGSSGQLSQPAGPLVFLFQIGVSGIGTMGLLAAVDPLLLTLPLFGVPALFAGGVATRRNRIAQESVVERYRMSTALFSLATLPVAGKEIRTFGLAPELRRRLATIQKETLVVENRARVISALLGSAGWLVFAVGYVGAVVFTAHQAARGAATVGDVLLTLNLALTVNGLVGSAVTHVRWLGGSLKTIGRYLWLIDYAAAAGTPPADPAPVPARITRGVAFEGVRFRYPETETDVLADVNLSIPPGATVAIVGDNGAGKSTLVKLLCRMYEPTAGTITVDGVSISRFEPEAWRERLSGAFQDYAKFEFIAQESVGVGELASIDDEVAVRAALDDAGATDVVGAMPSGLATQLGKRFADGVDLSGGQWQKVALGRAMMRREPLVLVLDEPTASLDAQTEHALFERYAKGAREVAEATGAITVLVSHRFSTVRMADLIVVVAAGRVTEVGSHADLVAAGGTYAELYELQARSYR